MTFIRGIFDFYAVSTGLQTCLQEYLPEIHISTKRRVLPNKLADIELIFCRNYTNRVYIEISV